MFHCHWMLCFSQMVASNWVKSMINFWSKITIVNFFIAYFYFFIIEWKIVVPKLEQKMSQKGGSRCYTFSTLFKRAEHIKNRKNFLVFKSKSVNTVRKLHHQTFRQQIWQICLRSFSLMSWLLPFAWLIPSLTSGGAVNIYY